MRPQRLLWHIFPPSLLAIVAAVLFVGWYASLSLQEFYIHELEKDLRARIILVQETIATLLVEESHLEEGRQKTEKKRFQTLQNYCKQQGRKSATRFTVIAKNGVVLADSFEKAVNMEGHQNRPEVVEAFSGLVGGAQRKSYTLGERQIYVALPLHNKDRTIDYVIRASVSVVPLEQVLSKIFNRVFFVSLIILVFAWLITIWVSCRISRPLQEMTKSAEQFARGDFRRKIRPTVRRGTALEIEQLAIAMDRMGALLAEKIGDIVSHHNQLETVFSNMVESVVTIDGNERIIAVNDAAAALFASTRKEAAGRQVQEVIRNVSLQQMIERTLKKRNAEEGEITLHDESGIRYLQAHVVGLGDAQRYGAYQGEQLGVLVVLNDVTRLRRLETIRRDFVANVSHELRTPITSIMGYVETLLDGALDDREDAVRFLDIVLRQARRLTAIFDDLLALSRIEEGTREGNIVKKKALLLPVVEDVLQSCAFNAEKQGVVLDYICPKDIELHMNVNLVSQALVNLIVNGISYNEEGGIVSVEVERYQEKTKKEEMVRIVVSDNGRGIASDHLPRLFERFYRSDKARSRSLGGTGLGLAIVKHIVQAHNGRVDVESVEGEGSSFILYFPLD